MSPNQADAMFQLIAADRRYRSMVAKGIPADPEDRGVEIWAHGSIHISTAESLERLGLAEMTDSRFSRRSRMLFLGKAAALDEIEAP